jgi:hypothetical protein
VGNGGQSKISLKSVVTVCVVESRQFGQLSRFEDEDEDLDHMSNLLVNPSNMTVKSHQTMICNPEYILSFICLFIYIQVIQGNYYIVYLYNGVDKPVLQTNNKGKKGKRLKYHHILPKYFFE